jgi:hypothetical protein
MEPATRGAQREGSGRRPIARAYRSGGALHPIEGALSPDRVPAYPRALELAGFESAAGAAGSLREQHRARRGQLRGNRIRRRCHTVGRALGGDVNHAAALPCRDVDRLAEVARQSARRRRDLLAVPARGQFRPREFHRSPAEPVAPARQSLRQPDAGQLSQQGVRGGLGDPKLICHLGRSPIRPLDREEVEHQGRLVDACGHRKRVAAGGWRSAHRPVTKPG